MLTPLIVAAALSAGPPAASGPALVVVNKDESSVSILDLASARVLATLPTGSGPHECAASADGRWAVVTNYGTQVPGSSLTVVDLTTLTVARTIVLEFARPHGISFLPDNRTVAVTSEVGQVVVLVDVIEGRVTGTAETMQRVSHMLALSADGRRAYTANIGPGTLSLVDLTGANQPKVLPVGPETEAIGLAPDESEVWLGSNSTGKVFAVDLAGWRVRDSVQTSGHPYRVTFSPDGRRVLVTNPFSDEVQLIDPATRRIVATIKTPGEGGGPGQPFGIAFHPDGSTAWITLRGANQVVELDLTAATVRRYLPAGGGPDGIAYTVRRES